MKNNKGITLIALIITIIIMLILAAVSISMAVNGGLFGYAGQATEETEKERDKEIKLSSGLLGGTTMEEYITGEKPVENPYTEQSWKAAFAVVNNQWTSEIEEGESIPENATMVLKVYQHTVETEANGCNPAGTKTMYQFVVEGEGDMPPYIPVNEDDMATSQWGMYELASSMAGGTIDEVYVCNGITSIANSAFRTNRIPSA